MEQLSRRKRILGESALLLVLLALVPLLVSASARRPWDFETYWYASSAALHGLDPYSNEQLSQLAGRPVQMPFVYPPITIAFFAPFTLLSFWDGRWIWLGLNVLALMALLQIWRRHLPKSVPSFALCLATALGFNASSMWSLKTGNVAIIEQLVLWLGLAGFIGDRRIRSAAQIAAASIFKLLPAAFLGLLVLPARGQRSRWTVPAISGLGLLALVFVPLAVGPSWTRGYFYDLSQERPWGVANPSALGLIDTLVGQHGGNVFSSNHLNLPLWIGFVALIALISIRPLRRAWRAQDPTLWVMTATPLFVLLSPRPMAYSYILAIPAMFYLLSPVLQRVGGHYAVAGILSAQPLIIPMLGLNYQNPWTSNIPFFLLFVLWSLYALRGASVAEEATDKVPGAVVSEISVARKVVPVAPKRIEPLAGVNPRAHAWQVVAILVAALAGSAWMLLAEHGVAGQWGFSLDDSWIYATFARNLATGHGYSFNPGESIGGATGPLYVFILAGLYWLFHGVIWPAKILGFLCLCASSLLVYRSTQHIDPRDHVKPLLAGLLTAISPSLLWGSFSGMEIPVYLLAACLGLHAYVRQKWTLVVMWWSLGVWLRPDGLFLALVGLVARPRLSLKNSFFLGLVAAGIIGAYFIFNGIVGGHLFPSSVGIKSHPGVNFPGTILGALRHWAGLWGMPFGPRYVGEHSVILLPALVVGAVMCFRRFPAIGIYVLGLPLAFALAGAPWSAFARYIMYVVPFGLILGLIGLERFCKRAFRQKFVAGLVMLGAVCVLWQVREGRLRGIVHGWNVENINDMHRFMAERIRKVASPGDTVAVNDVGAMGYFSGGYIVDLVGLVSPRRSFPENLTHYRPKLLVIFPEWYAAYGVRDPVIDNIVFYDSDSTYKWSPVVGVGLNRNSIASRNTMVLFERLKPGEEGSKDVPVYWH
jgi:alpha-1,2-mannosyltransferase